MNAWNNLALATCILAYVIMEFRMSPAEIKDRAIGWPFAHFFVQSVAYVSGIWAIEQLVGLWL